MLYIISLWHKSYNWKVSTFWLPSSVLSTPTHCLPLANTNLFSVSMSWNLFHIKCRHFSKGFFYLGPRGRWIQEHSVSSRASVCHNSHELQVCATRLQFSGLVSQVPVLKVGGADVGWTLLLWGKVPSLWIPFPLWVTVLGVEGGGVGGFYAQLCLSLSYPLPCGFPLICLMCRARVYVVFRGNRYIYSYRFSVSVRGGGRGSSYTAI